MSEIVSKEDYWQIILNDPSKVGQITTDDEKFNKVANFTYTVVQNTLLTTEDEDYLKKWEEMIVISGEGLTPFQRKVNILYMLSGKNYIPLNLVKRGLINLGISAFDVEYIKEENKLVIHTDRVSDEMAERVSVLLGNIHSTLSQDVEVERYNHYFGLSWRGLTAFEDIMGEFGFSIEYLQEENKLVVHTDRANDVQLEQIDDLLTTELPEDVEVEKYNHNIEVSWRDINKYAACKTVDDMTAINPDFRNDLTSDGEWVYPLPLITTLYYIFPNLKNLKKWSGALPKLGDGYANFGNTGLIEWNLDLPSLYKGQFMFCSLTGRIFRFKGKLPKLSLGDVMFQNTVLESFMEELPKLNTAAEMFTGSRLDKESVLTICGSIPAYESASHPLTIGIHIDHQNDEEVIAAIANAEAKGWTLTVQWNGTPTTQASATYGLRKPPIYASVREHEMPDGTTKCVLDWGHYVTNPEDYQDFSSLEEAYEHFNLEMPQTEE